MQPRLTEPASAWLPYVTDATWLPHDYDVRHDTLSFVQLPKDAQRRAVFLDPRFIARAPISPPAPVAELPGDFIEANAGPMHFIFHTAFCCSTLMTRALDVPGVSMGMKEPSVLAGLARLWSTGRRTPGQGTALEVTLDLLSRPLSPGETQIVKPSNSVNHIIPALLQLRPDSRALILFSSLDAFLRAIARRGLDGRAFAREVFQQFSIAIPLEEQGFTQEELFLQTDLQIAARAWLMQAAFLTQIAKRFGPSRVRIVSGDTFLEHKADVLERLARFFDLRLDSAKIAEIADGPVFKEHAKQPTLAFDAEAHKSQHDQAGIIHFDEINSVRAWARSLAARTDAPMTLEETLMADQS